MSYLTVPQKVRRPARSGMARPFVGAAPLEARLPPQLWRDESRQGGAFHETIIFESMNNLLQTSGIVKSKMREKVSLQSRVAGRSG
jgi:hypothetical protein